MSEIASQPATAEPKLCWYRFRLRTLLIFTTLCCIGLSLGVWCYRSLKPRSVADIDMITHFHTHKTHFETLCLMLAEDEQVGVVFSDGSCAGPGFRSEVTLSLAREAQYLRSLRNIELGECVCSSEWNQGSHVVDISAGYFLVGRNMILKSYTYSTADLAPLKDNLDAGNEEQPALGKTWYRRIEGHWYLRIFNAGSIDM